jgi:hypothetical protein
VRVLRKEAAKDGDAQAAAGPILVWNGLVTRMRRVSGEAESRVSPDVESETRPHGWGEPLRSGEESETQTWP